MTLVNDNIQKLASLFPSAVKDGELDLEALKQELGQFTEVGTEKYELTWAGKQEAKQTAFTPILGKTLKYIPEDSKNPDTTQNLYIEGDNLEVLKLLRQNYYGAVKMVYIDPPYNTGNDFIYKDDFKKSREAYEEELGVEDEYGGKLFRNTDSNGRFHSDWLSMMYERLVVARDLLKDDGVIFISIDDNEVHNLKKICDEVFGEENFLACMMLITGANQSGEGVKIQTNTEYCLVFSKSNQVIINRIDKFEESLRSLNDAPTPLETRPDMGYSIYYNPQTEEFFPVRDYDKTKIHLNNLNSVYTDDVSLIENGFIPIRPGTRNNKLHRWRWGFDTFLDRKESIVITSNKSGYYISFKQSGFNAPKNILNYGSGTTEVKNIFNGEKLFEFPKSVGYLHRLLSIGCSSSDIIIDFFSGSATTAHAVMQLNAEDGGNRRFIMVQLPESCDENSEAFKAGYKNIAEIGKERIRRAGQKILEENKEKEGIENLDVGFKVFRVGDI